MRACPHTGRPSELTDTEKQLLLDFLSRGAEAYGFRGDLWTSQRIGKVIEMEFHVIYHRSHIARLLKELKWTPQQPIKRAFQRNQAEIDYTAESVNIFLALHPAIKVFFFPPYAPELNPVDNVWGYIKHNRLANFCPHDLIELRKHVRAELFRIQKRPDLLESMFRHTGLNLD